MQRHLEVCGNITDEPNDNLAETLLLLVTKKDLSNFWRILEMPLIDCEFNLNLTI